MKITRYLWINNLPKRCDEEVIQKTFQSHGKIQTIRIHENNNAKGAIVAFIDCKSSTKAYESVKTLLNMPLKLDYCEANGEPGINSLGVGNDCSKNAKDNQSESNKNSDSRSRSSSSSSNTSSFGSSLDDCAKYPTIQMSKRLDNNNSIENNCDKSSSKSPRAKPVNDAGVGNPEKNEEDCLNKDYRGILVENLSQRSSDTSLREGLFHEYKKHGKITSVAVMGQGTGRHAIISFKRSEDMEKAFETSHGKIFFGNPIKVKKHNGYNYIDPDLCPPEHAMDEYHPKATKTLFVGKLATGAVVELDLRKVFKKYGEIIDIDIKTQSNQPDTSFAFVQYYDISSVVRALRNQDAIKVDGKPVKLGFGKSQPANCLWVGNLQRNANDSFLRRHFKRFGSIMLVIPDPEYNCALIQFEGAEDALRAFTDTRERSNNNNTSRRMQVDYASNEYQLAFMNRLRKSCQFDTQDFLKNISDPYQTEKIQNLLISYTKCLGLLDDTRTRSYDRYDPKSDYDDYDDYYSSRPSRQRKSVHQRLYNDSYGVDDDYSDEYHYSKPKGARHYDEYSSSRSPVRYSRTSQKYPNDQYGSHDSRRSTYQHYTGEYYDAKAEPSSSYYPYRRTPDTSYIHSNHNRSYSPSPTSSVDYCDDYPRYNLSPRRYSRSNKDYQNSSRSRQLDIHDSHEHHFDRTSEGRPWTKTSRREFDEFTSFRSKSGSKSKISDSPSPHVRTSAGRLRNTKNDQSKKARTRKCTVNNEDGGPRSSIGKVAVTTMISGTSGCGTGARVTNTTSNSSNITKTRTSGSLPSTTAAPGPSETSRVPTDSGTIPSVVQPVDALSKLERERAKLLEELSLLSEDTTATSGANKATARTAVKAVDTEATKTRKKILSPKESDVKASSGGAEKKVVVSESSAPRVKVEPRISDSNKLKSKETVVSMDKMPLFDVATLACSKIPSIDPLTPSKVEPIANAPPRVSSSLSTDTSSQSRDPRLNLATYHIRPISNPLSSISPVNINLILPVIPTTPVSEPSIIDSIPITTSNSYKDSTSDSDMDHFSNIDLDVDKRIRELDAKMNRNEQTVRTLDYSKFRIRKKVNEGAITCVTTSVSSTSSPSCLMVSPSSSMSTSNLLDIGYSGLGRDSGSNTSEFIKTMLNQTKQKTYHPLSDSNSDHLNSLCYPVPSTTCSSMPFRTVDLGANDIERRTLFSRFGSTTSNSLSFTDSKLNVDTSLLSPTISSYSSRLPTPTFVATTTTSKLSSSFIVSPSVVNTASNPITPNGVDSNQPMKSILKKSNSNLASSNSKQLSNKAPEPSKIKTCQDSVTPIESINSQGNGNRHLHKISHPNIKRKTKSESEEVDYKQHFKKSRNENGPVLDDTLFQTYPTMPVKKKMKKSVKKSMVTSPDLRTPSVSKKSSNSNNSLSSEKVTTKKTERSIVVIQPNQKLSKSFKENKKSNSKMLINKKSKLKPTSVGHMEPSEMRKGSSKSNKLEKVKKLSKRTKEKMYYDNRDIEDDVNEDLEDDIEDRFSEDDEGDSGSTDNDNYESMYDKIKRRNSKANRLNEESKRRHSFGKKRRFKQASELVAGSSDNLDSEDSEYWSVKSSKRSMHQKRKRPRLSDLSSSHFSDSNSCKTTPCGKTQDRQHLSEYSSNQAGPGTVKSLYSSKGNGETVKDESVTDESKAPAESFNLSSPPNSSQCSSPKYAKESLVPSSTLKDSFESSGTVPSSNRGKSLHRPNEGPLKKRPITEPIMLSEDLPYLEKQPEEEYIVSSPTSINDEPPSQLESMYDMPSNHQTNVLEEVVIDDHHHSIDVVDSEFLVQQSAEPHNTDQHQIADSPLPADVNSASHILLTMKSQPTLDTVVVSNEPPDQQLQSVAEHLISLAHNSTLAGSVACEQVAQAVPPTEEDKQHQSPQMSVTTRANKVVSSTKQDDEVTTYVKNIIDRIKQETDVANTLSKDRLACKRAKKTNTFNIPLSKPMLINNLNHECRHILPIDVDSVSRLASATITTTQQLTLATVTPSCVMVAANQILPDQNPLTARIQPPKPPQADERQSTHSDEATSTSSTDKRVRHNSGKSDSQLQSLDETIDNVVKSSMSSSASDAVSNKSVTDVDISIDETKSLSNSYESLSVVKGDLSSLEETMNEVINKMSVNSPSASVSSQVQLSSDVDVVKTNNSNTATKVNLSHDGNKHQLQQQQKKITLNHVKPSVYQLTGNVGGITNLVLGIPSILTVNTLVSQQQNQLNHMVNFQNSVSGQNQLTMPLNKLAVSSIQTSGAPSSASNSSQLLPSLSLTTANLNLQNLQQHNQNHGGVGASIGGGVQSTEMVFTKLNPLTPIMIQAPLRNITPLGPNNMTNKTVMGNRPPHSNTMGATFVSIGTGVPIASTTSTDTCSGTKLVSVALSGASINNPITTPANIVVSRSNTVTNTHGLNLANISTTSFDNNYYLMMQRHTNQQQPKPSSTNMGPSSTSSDVNVSGLTANLGNAGHSIILSQLTHTNSVLSPITPGYLTTAINRSNTATVPLHTLSTTNGITTTCNPSATTTSILFRPLSMSFPKFEEKDDWLKQNKQLEWNYPIRWTGKLCLKNDEVFVQMHMLAGNEDLIRNSMNLISAGQVLSQPLRIVQRMRLEPNQLEGLQRRLARQLEFCTCLTLAGGDKADELSRTSSTLNDNFINYLQEKSAAGIINICVPDSQQNAYVIHIFPPCEFSDNQLRSCSAKLYERLKANSVPYLVIVITTV